MRADGHSNFARATCRTDKILAQHCVAAIMLGDAVLFNLPYSESRTGPIAHHLEGSAECRIETFPNSA